MDVWTWTWVKINFSQEMNCFVGVKHSLCVFYQCRGFLNLPPPIHHCRTAFMLNIPAFIKHLIFTQIWPTPTALCLNLCNQLFMFRWRYLDFLTDIYISKVLFAIKIVYIWERFLKIKICFLVQISSNKT